MSLDARRPSSHSLIAPGACIGRVAAGLAFAEGPVWRGGALLFSDTPNDV